MEWGEGWGGEVLGESDRRLDTDRVSEVVYHTPAHARLAPCLPSIEGSTRHGRQRRERVGCCLPCWQEPSSKAAKRKMRSQTYAKRRDLMDRMGGPGGPEEPGSGSGARGSAS